MRRRAPEVFAPPRWLSVFTLVVTNLIKLGGLGVALDQVFFQSATQPVVLGVAALMMAGAQGLEEAALHLFKNLFGVPEPKPPARRRPKP